MVDRGKRLAWRHQDDAAYDDDHLPHRQRTWHEAGFTLLEMIVVVSVLGLALALVMTRGPMRSPRLEMQASISAVTQGLRLARSRAIANNSTVRFVVDPQLHGFRVDSEIPTVLPQTVSIAMLTPPAGTREAAIRFNGDGSASEGRIQLADGPLVRQVDVSWLTGRVTVGQAR